MKLDLRSSASMLALTGSLAMLAPVLVESPAHATMIKGSDAVSFAANDVTVSGGVGDLLSATSISFTDVHLNKGTQNFNLIPNNTLITTTPLTVTLSSLAAFSFVSADLDFTGAAKITAGGVTLSSEVLSKTGSIASGSETLALYIVGSVTPTGSTSAYSADNASLTLTLNETGITKTAGGVSYGSFSASATLAAPAKDPNPPAVPEPASTLLLGAGLIGLGAVRRRRSQG